jgi:hypothetical protein
MGERKSIPQPIHHLHPEMHLHLMIIHSKRGVIGRATAYAQQDIKNSGNERCMGVFRGG